MEEITLNSRTIGPGRPTYIIAEAACAHEGDFRYAAAMVDAAGHAGVSAVKFQVFSADGLVVPTHELHAAYVKFQFSAAQWVELADRAHAAGLDVWVDAFEPWSLDVAAEAMPEGLKVHSTNVTNPFFLRQVAAADLPVLIGTGGTERNEIAAALEIVAAGGAGTALIHGFQGYPTAPADTHLRRMAALAADFDVPVGFAGHAACGGSGLELQNILALGLGACILENHLILERSQTRTDYHSALLPDEMARMVSAVRKMETAAGSASYELGDAERKYRATFKSFIVAGRPMVAGHKLTIEDLAFKRADGGMLPADAERILGRTLAADVEADAPLSEEMFAGEDAQS